MPRPPAAPVATRGAATFDRNRQAVRLALRSILMLSLLVVVLASTVPASAAAGGHAPPVGAVPTDAPGGGSTGPAAPDGWGAFDAPTHTGVDPIDARAGAWTAPATVPIESPVPAPVEVPDDVRAPTLSPGVGIALAGYSRHDDSDPLAHETRRQVYEAVAGAPGTYAAAVVEETGIPRGTVRYHLGILEEERLVVAETVRGKRRYAPAGEDLLLAAALADEPARVVLEAVARFEPVTVGGLADEVDRSPSTVSHHLDAMSEDDLIERESDGRRTLVTLGPRTQRTAEARPGTATDRASADVRGE